MISTLVVGGGLKEKKEEVFRQPVAAFLQFKVAETNQNLVFPNLCSSGLQTHFIFYQFLIRRYHFLFASSKPICEIKHRQCSIRCPSSIRRRPSSSCTPWIMRCLHMNLLAKCLLFLCMDQIARKWSSTRNWPPVAAYRWSTLSMPGTHLCQASSRSTRADFWIG